MIGIVVGSESDLDTMSNCADKLKELNIMYDMVVASAHRNPDAVTRFIKNCE